MRDYVIINGVNSLTINGLAISKLPPISKPLMRNMKEEIDGRDGDIITKLGYSAYNKEFEIGLYGDFNIDDVIAYFNTEGTVVFSNESDKYYNYQILDQIDYEKLIRFKTAKVKMHVQPFKYPLEETPVEITIQNVTGSGENIDLDNTAEAPLTLALNGNTSQDGTPTPTTPVEVDTTTGGQNITICGNNILNIQTIVKGRLDNGVIGYVNNTTNLTLNDNSFSFTTNANYRGVTSDFIAVEGSMRISYDNYNSEVNITPACYDENKTFINNGTVAGNASEKIRTISVVSGTKYVRLYFALATAGTITINNPMLVKGTTAQNYEPYQNQSYEINLGKNLFDKNNTNSINAYINGSTRKFSSSATVKTYFINCDPDTTYTISKIASNQFRVGTSSNVPIVDGTILQSWQDNNATTYTITTDINAKYLCICIFNSSGASITEQEVLDSVQIEKGSTATPYAPYKTPIELCKIGDYQDRIYKDNGKWYLTKKIGKVVLNGSESWAYNRTTEYQMYYTTLTGYLKLNSITTVCDYYTAVSNNNGSANAFSKGNNTISLYYPEGTIERVYIRNDSITSANDFKEWLANNNISVYYILAIPTTTEITDQELIAQLEAINNARSYDPITHITQNTADKSFIINATTVQKGTDTGVVDNEGNIYSKPTIDIEGTGTAEIYLNNNQIFSVDLSTYNECIIDTTNLEAYNPATSQLMNRQVTGDYSNFKLNAGENQVKISGAVTKATITNYTRWV